MTYIVGYCPSCKRSKDEVATWSTMHKDEKLAVLAKLEKR